MDIRNLLKGAINDNFSFILKILIFNSYYKYISVMLILLCNNNILCYKKY